ncbi:MAG: enoyl-CoA hydratase-related protein [Candidatus Binatia bacterium]
MAAVEYEKRGPIVIITMNQPERRNAISRALMLGLAESGQRFAADNNARIAILIGAGNTFCSGMDNKERFASGEQGLGMPQISIRGPFECEELEKPTIGILIDLWTIIARWRRRAIWMSLMRS